MSIIITHSLCYNLIRVHCLVIKNINEEQQDAECVFSHAWCTDGTWHPGLHVWHLIESGDLSINVRIQGYFKIQWASPVVLSGKEYACSTGAMGDVGSIPGSGRSPGRGHGTPLQYSCLENPHGQRSLVCYSPWGHKESDMTKRLSTAHRG